MKTVNPFFEEKAISVEKSFADWQKMNSKPYDKLTASPYTKTRVILMNGTEFEANWFLHQFHRHTQNNDLRRDIALIRRHEQQQQKMIASLKPLDESNLETTISYEQLAVDLTAILAKRVNDVNVKNTLDFALLEDFDHLYRYSNLLYAENGIEGKSITLDFTEIMPSRPTIAEHRHPYDSVNKFICNQNSELFTKLATNIITAAEQQTMNYYMNIGNAHPTEEGRKLYAEIAMIEEQHVTEYGSLIDVNCSWLDSWLMHEYTECYLYYSCAEDETDESIKKLFNRLYLEECGHLKYVAALLEKYEGKTYECLFPTGAEFPEPIRFGENIDYVRKVIAKSVDFTRLGEGYIKVSELSKNSNFFYYNKTVNKKPEIVASHMVIDDFIKKFGKDYRFETKKNPIPSLTDRTKDNTDLGR